MNKKKLVAMLVSLSLVVVLGVGATLAMFTSQTNKLTNTFTVGDGIEAYIEEVVDDGETVVSGKEDDNGFDYKKALPGAELVKEPYMVIEAGSSKCYALMQVNGVDELEALNDGLSFTVGAFGAEWKKLAETDKTTSVDTNKNGIYILVDADKNPVVIDAADAEYKTANIFETVTLDNMDTDELNALKGLLEAEDANYDIVLKGCAIQADNAENLFGEGTGFDTLEALLLDEAVFKAE